MTEVSGTERKIKKVIYFDEGSATEYIQIIRGGNLEETTKLIDETNKNIEGKAGISISPLSSLLSTVIGIGASVGGEYQKKKSDMASSIISNTILTDFMKTSEGLDDEILVEENIELIEPEGSMTEFLKVSVYTNMVAGSQGMDEEYSLNMSKLDETLKQAKGYFEFKVKNDNCKRVYRFNIDSLRNNYRSTDLTKMKLTLYSIEVGSIKERELKFEEELKSSFKSNDLKKPIYTEDEQLVGTESETIFKLYDVILAGVE